MRANHEGISAFGLEVVFLVEAAGTVIFGEHGQVEIIRAQIARTLDRPSNQAVGDALALHFLDHIELAKLRRLSARFER